jgi:hypothetical protein
VRFTWLLLGFPFPTPRWLDHQVQVVVLTRQGQDLKTGRSSLCGFE